MKKFISKNFVKSLLVVATLGVTSLVLAQKPAVDAGSNKNLTGFVEICGSCINNRQYCRIFHNNRIIYSYYLPCSFNAASIDQITTSPSVLDIFQRTTDAIIPIWHIDVINT